jgi:hypothetical protein
MTNSWRGGSFASTSNRLSLASHCARGPRDIRQKYRQPCVDELK